MNAISLELMGADFDTPWRSQEETYSWAGQNLLYIECRVKGLRYEISEYLERKCGIGL